MVYLTGDCHGEFNRFAKKRRMQLPFSLTERDFVIVCGDMGLLWADDRELVYNKKWLAALPFKILWRKNCTISIGFADIIMKTLDWMKSIQYFMRILLYFRENN